MNTCKALFTNFASTEVFPWPAAPVRHNNRLPSSSFSQNSGSPVILTLNLNTFNCNKNTVFILKFIFLLSFRGS